MIYDKEKSCYISFPLGGIGSGCIGLAGNGRLIDWEIFNRPAKGAFNGISHFAVRSEEAGKVTGFRTLCGDWPPPYRTYGEGVDINTLAGWPHFREHSFKGTFPVAEMTFGGEDFPGEPSLTAWSVMIPGESRSSSLPAAFFEIGMCNPTDRKVDYTVIGVLANPWELQNTQRFNRVEKNQLTLYSGDGKGDLSLTLMENEENISYQTSFFRGGWRDAQESFFNDVLAGGRFRERKYEAPPAVPHLEPGLLASHFSLAPGEKRCVRFIISWSIPEYEQYWYKGEGEQPRWLNYYATQWKNSCESGRFAAEHYAELRKGTFDFRDALFSGNVPDVVKEAVSANLAVLKSPTCLRLEDGTFYGWEGVMNDRGSCQGSCSHVWNYAQALSFLFPDLERSMRASHLKYSVDRIGGCEFRLWLPCTPREFLSNPCADGQFGDVMKIYRDWMIGGDDDYIRHWWPTIKKTVEYAWHKENPNRWDPEQSGVLTGRQHHTLDMELFGPNAWLTGHYLGALDAAARMADFMEDHEFAALCRTIRARGVKYVNENLFNGEYFVQNISLDDKALIKSFENSLSNFDAEYYWNEEKKEIKYQISDGCGIDAVLAENYTALYGLDPVFETEKYRSTLRAVYKYNYRPSMRDVLNVWRLYALNDEGGVLMCTWPRGNKPAIPLTYNCEVMTGFEWAFAAQLAAQGMLDEALEIAHAVRSRYDGVKRNPWDEEECGHNYARSMASYGLLAALAGFGYDRRRGRLKFAPVLKDFSGFWALGEIWGTYTQKSSEAVLEVRHGVMELRELELPFVPEDLLLDGKKVRLPVELKAGSVLRCLIS